MAQNFPDPFHLGVRLSLSIASASDALAALCLIAGFIFFNIFVAWILSTEVSSSAKEQTLEKSAFCVSAGLSRCSYVTQGASAWTLCRVPIS